MEKDLKTPKDDESLQSSNNSKKRGLFARLPLVKALDLASSIYKLGEGEPVRRVTVFDNMGRSAESSLSRMLVTAANSGYSLITGGYQAERLGLTSVGLSLVNATPESEKYEIIYRLLSSNELFNTFVSYWADKNFPKDDIAVDWLVRNHSLSTTDAISAWNVFKANIENYKLFEDLSDHKIIINFALAGERIKKENRASSFIEPDNIPNEEPTENNEGGKNVTPFLDIKGVVKDLDVQAADINLEYGRARVVLPNKMTKDDLRRVKLQIDVMAIIVDADESRIQEVEGK
jgi:hypothetical protein